MTRSRRAIARHAARRRGARASAAELEIKDSFYTTYSSQDLADAVTSEYVELLIKEYWKNLSRIGLYPVKVMVYYWSMEVT